MLVGRGQGGKGKGKGAIVSETCRHLGGEVENEESPCSADWPRIANGQVCQPPLVSAIDHSPVAPFITIGLHLCGRVRSGHQMGHL